jgi:hypothetical protein
MDLPLRTELIHLQNWLKTYISKPKSWSRQVFDPN